MRSAGPVIADWPQIAGVAFVHNQVSAASAWTINHNMGFRPSVEVMDSGGVEVIAEVRHVTFNQVQILFSSPMAGLARFT